MILVAPRRFALPRFSGRTARGRPGPAGATVTHRFALQLDAGKTETVPEAACCAMVRCTEGSVWITHDGDPKDVLLGPGESYAFPRSAAMLVHALSASAVEMHFVS
jgi:hypothetical protein